MRDHFIPATRLDVLRGLGLALIVASQANCSSMSKDGAGSQTSAAAASTGSATVTPGNSSTTCLDVSGSQTANGTAVQVWSCNGTNAQAWTYTGGNLQALGKCLTVTGGSTTNGTKVELWDCSSVNASQQWTRSGSTWQWSGTTKCLDLPMGNTASGTRPQIWDCVANDSYQTWNYAGASSGTAGSTPGGSVGSTPGGSVGSTPGGSAAGSTPGGSGGSTPGGSTTTSTTSKRGIAYTNENAADAPVMKGMSWWYDWTSSPSAAVTTAFQNAGVEYVPMIWSGPPNRSIDVQGLINSIPSSAKYLLGFNEPDFNVQANLTPQQAAAAWPQLQQIAQARNLKLVSPAMNYCGGGCNQTDPFVWLNDFFSACSGCQVDYIAFHWYNCDVPSLQVMLQKYEAYGKPVWLTEFACLEQADKSLAAQETWMKAALPVLEADPKVFRYSWFMGRSSPAAAYDVFGSPGSLTTLGQQYVSLP